MHADVAQCPYSKSKICTANMPVYVSGVTLKGNEHYATEQTEPRDLSQKGRETKTCKSIKY